MRGAAGTVVLVEEMAFMGEEFWRTVIVPLFMTGASLIGITTLEKPGNWVGALIDVVREDGTHLIDTVALTFSCDSCNKAGMAAQCTHAAFDRPRWQNPQTLKDIELMNLGHKDDLGREAYGVNCDSSTTKIFEAAAITDMSTTSVKHTDDVDIVYISVDPAAGGKGSRFAVVSCVYLFDKMLIAGIDLSDSYDPAENDAVIVRHMRTLRSKKIFKYSKFIVGLEKNLGNEAPRIRVALQGADRNCEFLHDKQHRVGIWTDHGMKRAMAEEVRKFLNTRSIHYMNTFFTNTDFKTNGNPIQDVKREVMRQLSSFERRVVEDKDQEKATKVIYTGKNHGPDDFVMGLFINIRSRNLHQNLNAANMSV